jgi:hypothetical protein
MNTHAKKTITINKRSLISRNRQPEIRATIAAPYPDSLPSPRLTRHAREPLHTFFARAAEKLLTVATPCASNRYGAVRTAVKFRALGAVDSQPLRRLARVPAPAIPQTPRPGHAQPRTQAHHPLIFCLSISRLPVFCFPVHAF